MTTARDRLVAPQSDVLDGSARIEGVVRKVGGKTVRVRARSDGGGVVGQEGARALG